VEEFKDSDTEENAENSAMQMKEDSLPPLLANNKHLNSILLQRARKRATKQRILKS
jgi:hypothetical protein